MLGAADTADDITWWNLIGYPAKGTLESSILEIAVDVDTLIDWNAIFWAYDEPAGTDICFQVRGSDDPGSMGAWSDTISVVGTGLDSYLDDTDRYIQYKTILETDDPLELLTASTTSPAFPVADRLTGGATTMIPIL